MATPHPKPNRSTFRVLTVNFQSTKAKRTSLWLLLSEANPDIVIRSETWLHEGICEMEVLQDGYHFIAPKNGVAIIAKDSITGTDINKETETEFTSALFECPGNSPLIIGALYIPPNTDLSYMEELRLNIRELYKNDNPRATIWIAGDANLPDIDWETDVISGNSNPLQVNQRFLYTMHDTGSEQIVRLPKRGKNILHHCTRAQYQMIGRKQISPQYSGKATAPVRQTTDPYH